jgi:hypothetical protein
MPDTIEKTYTEAEIRDIVRDIASDIVRAIMDDIEDRVRAAYDTAGLAAAKQTVQEAYRAGKEAGMLGDWNDYY